MTYTRESTIEEHWHKQVVKRGGFTYKFTVLGRRNVPDRITMLPLLGTAFVELKAPGEKPTPAQKREHDRIRTWGGDIEWFDTKFEIDLFFAVYDAQAIGSKSVMH